MEKFARFSISNNWEKRGEKKRKKRTLRSL
jgi:hypothetical protein